VLYKLAVGFTYLLSHYTKPQQVVV